MALEDAEEYPSKSGARYEAMKGLHERLCTLSDKAYERFGGTKGR